ncbi:MAG: MarR family winged helix-turn-helix transcriptional regulator [Spirochaetota bacterium]|nr:MarR family winged helix-turn-helix transcriptional regulator [Spirochaetota bacterium]
MIDTKADDRLIFLISKVYQKLMNTLKQSLQNEGIDITPIQMTILFFLLKNDGCTLTELSRGVVLENSTVTGLIDRLEISKCVERRKHPSDRRAYSIYLTDKGRSAAIMSLPIVKKVNDEIKEGCSNNEIDSFKKVMLMAFNKFK